MMNSLSELIDDIYIKYGQDNVNNVLREIIDKLEGGEEFGFNKK